MAMLKTTVAKKSAQGRSMRLAQPKRTLTTFSGDEQDFRSNGKHNEQSSRKNPETEEERNKRLAKREALTLKAFKIAYDNHHRRKSS